jgi:hypothetical protein
MYSIMSILGFTALNLFPIPQITLGKQAKKETEGNSIITHPAPFPDADSFYRDARICTWFPFSYAPVPLLTDLFSIHYVPGV